MLERQRDTHGAIRHLLTAATIEPDNAELHYRLGLLYLQRDRAEDALKRFLRVVEIDPKSIDAHRQVAEIYESLGRKREAVRHLSAVHRLTRDS